MTLAQIVSLFVGLTLVALLLGLVVMLLAEWLAHLSMARGRTLRRGIARLLGESPSGPLTEALYRHALIAGLSRAGRLPSYIPGHAFALALLDALLNGAEVSARRPVTDLSEVVEALRQKSGEATFPQGLISRLVVLLDLARDMDEARLIVEHWYDDGMARLRGDYKRLVQFVLMVVAFALAFALNADGLLLARLLPSETGSALIGWSCLSNCDPADVLAMQPLTDSAFWLVKLAGIALSSLVITFAASLLFDVLARVMHLRTSGSRPISCYEE